MWLRHKRSVSFGASVLFALAMQSVFAGVAIEDYERRPVVQNQLLEERLDSLLPTLMRETGYVNPITLWTFAKPLF